MILIWGFKVRFRTLMEGVFFCPTCGGDRHYRRQQGKRWFTFFFIPIIPLGDVGEEFVECHTCRKAYKLSVLDMPTSAALSDHLLGALREALATMLRQAPPSPGMVRAAVDLLASTANRPWTDADLQSDVAHLDTNGLQARLGALATALNEHGKESLLDGLARVAAADGAIGAPQRQFLDFVAASLGMTAAHARGVIDHVTQRL